MGKCEDCKFFEEHERGDQNDERLGWCHRFPPLVLKNEEKGFVSVHPTVPAENFCGEFVKSKEDLRLEDDS